MTRAATHAPLAWRGDWRRVVVDALTSFGMTVHSLPADEIMVEHDEEATRVHLHRPGREPSKGKQIAVPAEQPVDLYLVRRVSERMLELAASDPSVAIVHPERGLIAFNGKRVDAAVGSGSAPAPMRGRPAFARLALMRALVRTSEPRTQIALAAESGVTQAAVSKALEHLGWAVMKVKGGWVANDPGALWDSFLDQYPGVGGTRSYWFSLDTATEQADRVSAESPTSLVSGDVALDRIAPWRRPDRAIIYAGEHVDLTQLGFVPTTSDRATLEFVMPLDTTLQHTAAAWARGENSSGPEVTDPLIACGETLFQSANVETREAVTQVRERVMRHWNQ